MCKAKNYSHNIIFAAHIEKQIYKLYGFSNWEQQNAFQLNPKTASVARL